MVIFIIILCVLLFGLKFWLLGVLIAFIFSIIYLVKSAKEQEIKNIKRDCGYNTTSTFDLYESNKNKSDNNSSSQN